MRWARGAGRLIDGREILSRVTGGGAEHMVFFDRKTQRYTKITRGFGLTVGTDYTIGKQTQRWLGVPFVREATPLDYLERIVLFNAVFGDDITLESVISDPGSEAIVTSQPVVQGRETSPAEIARFMTSLDFAAVPGVVAGRSDSVSFFRAADRTGVFDTHGENFLTDGRRVAPRRSHRDCGRRSRRVPRPARRVTPRRGGALEQPHAAQP